MRISQVILLCALVSALAGCGGGGSGSANDSSISNTNTINTSDTTAQVTTEAAPNVMTVTVDLGPSRNVNIPYTSVTICEQDSNTKCRTIDHVLIDTGSNGLRLFASTLAPAQGLPTLSLGQVRTSSGALLAECVKFADSSAIWGQVKQADIKLAGQRISLASIHVVGDTNFSATSSNCSNPINTAESFGANGILGVGNFVEDCGEGCQINVNNRWYYACTSTCTPTAIPLSQQVQNPVALLATDNNGVVLKMPSVGANGAVSATGSLIFGIGTRDNNTLSTAAKVFKTDSSGLVTTVYKGRQYPNSFIDSGSNAIYFNDSSMTVCNDYKFFCPSSTLDLSATIIGSNGISDDVSFSIASADQLFAPPRSSYVAFSNLGGPLSLYFDWGLPFFYGRSVFTAIDGKVTPAGKGPYYAY